VARGTYYNGQNVLTAVSSDDAVIGVMRLAWLVVVQR